MKEGICTGIGVIGGFIASLFGGWDAALITLLLFMGIDYISGLIVAGVFTIARKRNLEHQKVEQVGKDFVEKE